MNLKYNYFISVMGRQMRGPYASLYAPQGTSIRYYLYFMHRELGTQGAALVPGKNAMVGKLKPGGKIEHKIYA